MIPPADPAFQASSPEQEVEALKSQSQMLAQQLSAIQQRLEQLENKGE